MKLNLDCMRQVLIQMEEAPYGDVLSSNQLYRSLTDYSHDEIDYAILKLKEAGFIRANIEEYIDGSIDITLHDITYNGHQFLANIRGNKIWSTTKSVMGKIGSTSVRAAAEIATSVVSELIKQTMLS